VNEVALANKLLAARQPAGLLPLPQGLDLAAAYRVATLIDRQRSANGERPRG
jgi:hypothetical protein